MIISNYIFKQTLRNVIVSTLVFISVVWLSQSFKTIKLIIDKGGDISDFMILSAYSFPSWFIIALPFGIFTGCMISYVRLENDKEIVVMKAAGISFMGVSSPAIIISIIASIILFLNVHFLLPFSYANFKAYKTKLGIAHRNL
jgi:lipopolysaccharide export system permease protein